MPRTPTPRCMPALFAITPALLTAATQAANIHWINPAGGSFHDGANWQGGVPPGPTDTPFFTLPATYTVTITQDLQLHGLTIGGIGGDVTLIMTGRTIRLGTPYTSGTGLHASGAVRFHGGTIIMGYGDVTIHGAPFEATGTAISDKLEGAGRNSRLTTSGILNMVDSGMGLRTPSISGQLNLVNSGFGGEHVGISNCQIIGGRISSSESTGIGGPFRAAGGACVYSGSQRPLRIHGNAVIEGEGTTLFGLSRIDSGETRIRAGAVLPSGSAVGVVQTARLVIEEGANFGPGVWLADSGAVRIEPGANGPAFLELSPTPAIRIELVIDAARPTPFVPVPISIWSQFLAGTLALEVGRPHSLRLGDEILLLTSLAPLTGAFDQIITPTLHGGRVMEVVAESHRVFARIVAGGNPCWTADIDGDGDSATDSDIEAFFACLAGNCCPTCAPADFNSDGQSTDADIESFFRVLAGGPC